MDPSSLLAEQQRRPRAAPTAEEYTNTLSMYQKRVAWSEEVRRGARAREREKGEGGRPRGGGRAAAAASSRLPLAPPPSKNAARNARVGRPLINTNQNQKNQNTHRRTPS